MILGDGPLELFESEHLWPDRVLGPEGVLDEGGHVQVEEQRVSRVHARRRGPRVHLQLGRPHRHVGGLATATPVLKHINCAIALPESVNRTSTFSIIATKIATGHLGDRTGSRNKAMQWDNFQACLWSSDMTDFDPNSVSDIMGPGQSHSSKQLSRGRVFLHNLQNLATHSCLLKAQP